MINQIIRSLIIIALILAIFLIKITNIFIISIMDKSIFYLINYIAFILTMHVILFSINKVSYFQIPPIVLYKNNNKKTIKLVLFLLSITMFIWLVHIVLPIYLIDVLYFYLFTFSLISLTILLFKFFRLNYLYMTGTEEYLMTVSTGKELYDLISLVDKNVEFVESEEIFSILIEKLSEKEVDKFNEILKEKVTRYYSNKTIELIFLKYMMDNDNYNDEEKYSVLFDKIKKKDYKLLAKYTSIKIQSNYYNIFNNKDFIVDLALEKKNREIIGDGNNIASRELKELSDFMDNYIMELKSNLSNNILLVKYFSQFLINKDNGPRYDLYFKKFINLIFIKENLDSKDKLIAFNFILKYCSEGLEKLIFNKSGIFYVDTYNNLDKDKTNYFPGKDFSIKIAMGEELTFENIKSKIEKKIEDYNTLKIEDKKRRIILAYLDLFDMQKRYKHYKIYEDVTTINIVNDESVNFFNLLVEENYSFIEYFKEKKYDLGDEKDVFGDRYDPEEIVGSNINGRNNFCLLLTDHKLGGEVKRVQEEKLDNIINSYDEYINSIKECVKDEKKIESVLQEGIGKINKKVTNTSAFINNLTKHLFNADNLEDKLGIFETNDEDIKKTFMSRMLKYSYVVEEKTLNSLLLTYYISYKEMFSIRNGLYFFNNTKYDIYIYRKLLDCILDTSSLDKSDDLEEISINKTSINYIIYLSRFGVIGEFYYDWEYNELEGKYIRRGDIAPFNFGSINRIGLYKLFRSDEFIKFLEKYHEIKGYEEKLIDFEHQTYKGEDFKIDERYFPEISILYKGK